MSDHQTVTGTLTERGATSAQFYLRPGEVVAVTATFTGAGKVSLSQVLGQPAQAYRPLVAWTTSQSATEWRNTTNQDLYLVLRADTLDTGASVAYTLADVAGDQILQDWVTADGTLVARITDQGIFGLSYPLPGESNGVINVMDPQFGAVGDGVTDDTDAIQAGLTRASAVGVDLFVPDGTYLCDALTLTGSARIVLSRGTVIKQAAGQTAPLLTVSGGDWMQITGGKWQGQASQVSLGLIEIDGPTVVDVDTWIVDAGFDGIRVQGLTRGFLRVRVEGAGNHGIHVLDSSHVQVDADVDGTGASGVQIRPETVNCEYCTVRGVVRNTALTAATGVGIYFNSGDSFVVRHSVIGPATVFDAGWVGVFPGGDHNTCVGVVVDGSGQVTAATGHGFWLHDSSDLTLSGCISRRSARSGFLISKAHKVALAGCAAQLNANAGFNLTYDATASGRYQGTATNKAATLSGCIADENGTGTSNTWPGFYIDGYRRITFAGCQAHDYSAVQTQQRGILAATNALTEGIQIIGGDFSGNISATGVSVAEAYMATGFYGKTPIARAVLATGASATVDNVITALQNLGLVRQS